MPYNKATAAEAGRKGGRARWQAKDPATVRNKQLRIALSETERELITGGAKKCGISFPEFIVRAVRAFIEG